MARILVVDDESQMRDLIRKALGMKGHEVTATSRVDEALAVMQSAAFDLVLTDINMPGESGTSLLQKVGGSQAKIPIVVYSGVITIEMEKELREAGAAEVLKKDVGINTLVEQIGKIVMAKDRIFKEPLSRKEKTVLIVDDETDLRKMLCEFFRKKGYNTQEAKDGEEAVERVGKEKPSVVLLDMQMPGMGGLETLKKILALHPDLGVLMMSGVSHDEENVHRALQLGAYSYILKPFDFLYLELVVSAKAVIAEGG